MSNTSERAKLYEAMGYTGPMPARPGLESFVSRAKPAAALASFDGGADVEGDLPTGSEPPPLDELGVEILTQQLRSYPEETVSRARELWNPDITREELEEAIEDAARLLRAPALALDRVKSTAVHAKAAAKQLPPEFFQDWPYDPEIPIDPTSTKFETRADAAAWVLFSGPALLGSLFAKKAPFEWHHRYLSRFVYDRPGPTASTPIQIALVSDFGTGLYHSKYIAKHFVDASYPYVVHGGDVYYAGRDSEFRTNFKPQIDPLLNRRTQVFTMNANHEMYSCGGPYFAYIKERRQRDPEQLQEGSYFCLRFGNTLQLVGIDTAYFRDGRFDESSLQRWLRDVLIRARELGMINVLFSPNEPYTYGSTSLTKLLTEDVSGIVRDERLVDLWFWGNTHYCALFDQAPGLPFIGSCVGHGGYPYDRMHAGKPSAAPVRFLETGARFPAWTGVRQDRGNNGYCELSVTHDATVTLSYIDWMRRTRATAKLTRTGGVLQLSHVG